MLSMYDQVYGYQNIFALIGSGKGIIYSIQMKTEKVMAYVLLIAPTERKEGFGLTLITQQKSITKSCSESWPKI